MPLGVPASFRGKIILLVAGLMAAAAACCLALIWLTYGPDLTRQQDLARERTLETAALLVRDRLGSQADRRLEAVMEQRAGLQRELGLFMALAEAEYVQEKAGLISRSRAQAMVLEAARQASARTGTNYFIFDSEFRGLAHAHPAQVGTEWRGLRGFSSPGALEQAAAVVRRDGSDTLVLWWPKAGKSLETKHLALLASLPDWGWHVGVSVDYGRIESKSLQYRNRAVHDTLETLSRVRLGKTGRLFVMEGHAPAFLLLPPGIDGKELADTIAKASGQSAEGLDHMKMSASGMELDIHTLYLSESGWRIGLVMDEAELCDVPALLAWRLLAGLGLVAVAGIVLAWAMSKRITTALRRLSDTVCGMRFTRGEIPERVGRMRALAWATPGEVGALATAWVNALERLNGVIGAPRDTSPAQERSARELAASKAELEAANEDLEARVRMRTADLEATNRSLTASEARYRGLFMDSPVAFMELDFSPLAALLDIPDVSGATDFRSLFQDENAQAAQAARRVRLLDANPAAVALTGAETKAQLSENLFAITHPDGLARCLEMAAGIKAGAPVRSAEVPLRRLSGEELDVVLTMRPLPGHEERLAQVLLSLQDITELKLVQERLRAANERALSASRAKSEFLANMSHELRTPISAILGLAELCRRNPDAAKTASRLGMIAESAQKLLEIIGNVLDLSRVESGKLTLKDVPFSWREVIDKSLAPLKPLCARKGLDLQLDLPDGLPERLRGDPLRLGQILSNLAVNALKFTASGYIRVSVSLEERSGDTATLRFGVRDSGTGIDPGLEAAIFESFRQADESLSKNHQGAGLGLAICRELAGLMGGRIWVESEPGQGSAFFFTAAFRSCPAVAGPEEGPAPDPVKPAHEAGPFAGEPAGPARVLVVEDNPVNRHVFTEYLELLGYVPVTACDGVEALETLSATPVDFVFMDVQMPRMDGVQAIRRIRAGECGSRAAGLPVVALTAYAMSGDRERFLAEGMNDYLPKPVSLATLQDVLARLMPQSLQSRACRTGAGRNQAERAALEPLMAEFLQYVRTRADQAAALLRSGDLAEAAKAAHDVKGSSMAFGVGNVNKAGERLEAAIKAGSVREALVALDAVYKALDELNDPPPAMPLSMA